MVGSRGATMRGEADTPVVAAQGGSPDRALTAVVNGLAYGVIFVLGVVLAVVAGFEHALSAPMVAVLLLVALFAVPYGLGRLMKRRLAALIAAVGWAVMSGVLSGQRGEGDLVFAANAAGYIYLYGGTLVMVIAVLMVPSSGTWLLGPGRDAGRPSLPR